mmetsp:Transcript_23829/g.47361  ORF Transcript_23829/g.47361 Transcript_23829/m.47361 type:complete len:218 (+) Transcript_23829:259-912(+)
MCPKLRPQCVRRRPPCPEFCGTRKSPLHLLARQSLSSRSRPGFIVTLPHCTVLVAMPRRRPLASPAERLSKAVAPIRLPPPALPLRLPLVCAHHGYPKARGPPLSLHIKRQRETEPRRPCRHFLCLLRGDPFCLRLLVHYSEAGGARRLLSSLLSGTRRFADHTKARRTRGKTSGVVISGGSLGRGRCGRGGGGWGCRQGDLAVLPGNAPRCGRHRG